MPKNKKFIRKPDGNRYKGNNEKNIQTPSIRPTNGDHPVWSFAAASKEPFPFPFKNGKAISDIIDKLASFEGMTIDEMLIDRCTDNSPLLAKYDLENESSKICKECIEYLAKYHKDTCEIYRFRLGNKERLFALRIDNTFALLWWDENHEIYSSR